MEAPLSVHIWMRHGLVFRLLTVEAGQRLTVDQVLAHAWLHEAPHTQLNSPAVMLDQVCVGMCL